MEPWVKPEVTEIRMSAEIGGYQPDEDPERVPAVEPPIEEAAEGEAG